MRDNEVFVTDFSGHNWDDVVIDKVYESTQLEPAADTPTRPVRMIYSHLQPPAFDNVTVVDLSHADLHRSDLRNANLNGANLARANLSSARLDHASLVGANLRGADLRGAHLPAAKTANAHLYGAIFDHMTDLPFEKEEALRRGMIYLEIE